MLRLLGALGALGAAGLLGGCGSDGDKPRARDDTGTAAATDDDPDPPVDTDTDTDTDTDVQPVAVTVTVEPNPHNVLACFVRWTTATPSSSEVTVTAAGETFRIADPAPVTDHRVLVIALHAETPHDIVATGVDAHGLPYAGETTYTTEALPEGIPVGAVPTRRDDDMEPGWTLLNVTNREQGWPPTAVMYAPSGRPVWYHQHGDETDWRGDVDVSLVDGTHVLIGHSGAVAPGIRVDLAGEVVWTGPLQPGPTFLHHQLALLDDGTYLTLQGDLEGGVMADHLRIFDSDHASVWNWRLRDHLPPPPAAPPDWSHCNAAEPGNDPDHLIVSCRNIHTVMAVSRSTREIVWKLGVRGDFEADPDAAAPFTRWQHAPKELPNGNLLVYDNNGLQDGRSRVVEFALDHPNLRSTIAWEFPGDLPVSAWYHDTWFTPFWGDVDRLANGNTLVTSGTLEPQRNSRVFEVSATGEVVWELDFPSAPGSVVGLYRADRIVPPLLE